MGKLNPVLIAVILLFFGGGPLIVLTIIRVQKHTKMWFNAHGERITATVTFVFRARSFYHVSAKWDDPRTHKSYYFESNGVPVKPAYHSGDPFPVLVDPKNPKHYLMLLDPEDHRSVTLEGTLDKRQTETE